jgi:hypothetical protein
MATTHHPKYNQWVKMGANVDLVTTPMLQDLKEKPPITMLQNQEQEKYSNT